MSHFKARRKYGSCYGTLMKQHSAVSTPSNLSEFKDAAGDKNSVATVTAALEKNERSKFYEFCVLIGNTMTCYEQLASFRRGDHPSSEIRIVGASAWNPPQKSSKGRRALSPSPPYQGSSSTSNSNHLPTFRLLTHAGTHVYCTAQDSTDCDIWLSALHSGLEITYAGYEDTLTILKKLLSSPEGEILSFGEDITVATPKPPKSLVACDVAVLEPVMLTPPAAKRTRVKNLVKRAKSHRASHTPCAHNVAFMDPYESDYGQVSRMHCLSCGRYPPENAMKTSSGTPVPHYCMENRIHLCHPCMVGQGVLRHVTSLTGLYASDAHERVALMKGRDLANRTVEKVTRESNDAPEIEPSNSSEALDNVAMTPAMITGVMNMINGTSFAACRRRSSALDDISSKLENSVIGAAEFLELLNEYALEAIASSTMQTETIQMKKEALMVAGDMRAAIKILHENALPKASGSGGVASSKSTEMLSCILEFFLDLCEQGELSSIEFFWPQMCQIHLQMIPATDSESLARVELMEDFLLTVCAKHSIHLGLEIVWSCVADLEESIGSSSVSPSCRRRRFALVRFLCELESLIFDIDGGWGGGTVSMRGMYSPSEHQSTLIRNTMGILQMHRRFSSHHLSRSVRLEKLNNEARQNEENQFSDQEMSTENAVDAAEKKFVIARSAEYFSTQLMFCRRLGDIAEKLRFMEVEERVPALENELENFNASGRLGGDPLNTICGQGSSFMTVLKIPKTEGHVFRSKERTPLLLLMEVCRDENGLDDKGSSSKSSKLSLAKISPGDFDASVDMIDIGEESHEEEEEGRREEKDLDLLHNESSSFDDDIPSTPKVSHLQQVLKSPIMSTGSDAAGSVAEVENLVADAVKEKLKISIPDFDVCSSHSFQSCDSQLLQTESIKTVDRDAKVCDILPQLDLNEPHVSHVGEENITGDDNCRSSVIDEPSEENRKLSSGFRKVSAFGSLRSSSGSYKHPTLSPDNLAAHGEGRRLVLTTMFTKGQRSSNLIARGVAPAARRAIQAMDRKRAQLLMNAKLGEDEDHIFDYNVDDDGWKGNGSMNDFKGNVTSDEIVSSSEEDECVEAIRLLLVQNSVALGKISPENAVKALNLPYSADEEKNKGGTEQDDVGETDAGDIDPRLTGCGTVTDAVLRALELWKQGLVSNTELLDLIQKDLQYTRLALPGAENESKLKEDSVFWGRFAFGERWAEKKARIQATSVFGTQSGWDLTGVIIKSNDDLRQEAFAMQLIELCAEAFEISGLELWTYPYRILATGRTTGIIEMVRNSMSFDSLKKRPGFEAGGLLGHFKKMAEYAADPSEALKKAKKNFVTSLAAYSLLSYFFVFKDRHNGNLLLDTAGHVIHIDFGFIFGIAPGGTFSLEQSIPFKLTEEMIDVMDGLGSVLFSEFVTLFCCGFLALQAHCDTFETIVGITCEGSTFKCFEGKDSKEITTKLRERFCPHLSKEETVGRAMDLIRQACNATGTKQYDFFQYMSQGIAA